MACRPGVRPLNSYRIFDLLLTSDILLPELPEVRPAPADLQVVLRHTPPRATPALHWDHHWRDSAGETTLSLAKPGADYILRSPELADFRISGDCKHIEIVTDPAIPVESIRHLLLDQVLPRVVAQRGRPVLHASAVRVNNAVIAFMGDSRAGKSTIATWFYQMGHALLSDDSLALDVDSATTRIVPSYAGARLWDDSPALSRATADELSPIAHYSDKLRLNIATGGVQQALALKALLVLAPGQAVTHNRVELTPLTGAQAVMALVRHSFQLDMTDTGRSSTQLGTLSDIVNRGLPIYQLTYPHTPTALDEVSQRVCSLVSTSEHETCTGS